MVAKPLCPLYKNIIKPLDRARYPELRYVLQKKRGCVMDLWHTLLFDFNKIFYLFSASIALIFSFTSFKSSLSFSTLRFISSTRLLPFLLAALRKPRLFS